MSKRDDSFNEQPFDISKMPTDGTVAAHAPEGLQPIETGKMTIPSQSRIEWTGGSIDFVGLARRYALWLVVGLIGGGLLGHSIYRKLGPEYTATSKILVAKRAAGPISDHQEAETFGGRSEHIALIMSPLIVEKAVELHELDQLPSMLNSNDPAEDILDSIKVSRSAGHDRSVLNVLDVTSQNGRREDAKKIVAAVIDAYHAYLTENHNENIEALTDFASRKIGELRKQIEGVEAEYAAFRRTAPIHLKAPIRGPNGERSSVASNVHQEILETLEKEQQLVLARKAEIRGDIQSIESELTNGRSREEIATTIQLFAAPQSKSSTDAATAQALNPHVVRRQLQSSLDAQLLPLILKEKELLQQYAEDWPDVVAIRGQIDTVKTFYHQRGLPIPGQAAIPGSAGPSSIPTQSRSMAKTINGLDVVDIYLQDLRRRLNSLQLREQEIERQYTVEFQKANALTPLLEQDRRLNDELDRLHSLWSAMKVEAAKFDIEKDNLGYSLKVIAPAKDQLSLKRVIKLYGAGIVAVMGLICGLIFLREWTDTTLKSVDEIRDSLSIPILGTVPAFDGNARGIPGSPLQTALCYFHRPGSPEAEAYRSVRTAFFVSVTSGQRLIQVTSPEPGDGKSTLIANLAIAVAQSGRKVLLIDSDLRRPTLHTLFGLRRDVGIGDVLSGEIDLLTAAQQTVADGLSVLTCGALPANPAEILSSPQYGKLLNDAQSEFDLVLVDTPPLLAVSDPCIVAQRTHALILVLRMMKNKRNAAKRASELIQTNNIPVIGLVCNGTDAVSEGYGYRETYGEYLDSRPADVRDDNRRKEKSEKNSKDAVTA